METQTDSLWVLALLAKCKALSSINTLLVLLSFFLGWLATAFFYWASCPGGPAWAKYYRWWKTRAPAKATTMIPGPRGFPILGSMNLMTTQLAHQQLAKTADLFGAKRLMAYSLGDTRVVMTCNPDVAREILNSSVFSDRPIKESAYSLMFDRAIGFAPYGVYWRTLRRIAAAHLFSPKQIQAGEGQRHRIASQMVSLVSRETIRIRDLLKRASLLNMMGSVFGRRYDLWSSDAETQELSRLVDEGYDLLGKLNWSDHLPWAAAFDLQKIRSRCSKLVPKVNCFVNRIIQQHKIAPVNCDHQNPRDFVHVLLSLQGSDKLSDHDMIAVLWEMVFRGTDTVAVLIEWILARMVLHPDVQSKVQDEIDRVVGGSQPLMESDIRSTVFLQAVVKEVLRLHPPGPLLSWARLAITDTTVDNYHVPVGTTAIVNMWAITRDPQVWSDPLEFMPERFMSCVGGGGTDMEFSVFGSDLRLAPFGSGRRSCPGKSLGWATVVFWVGSLLHKFEWTKSDQNPVNLSEVLKLSCEMAEPLIVNVRPRR